ncbi:MAG: hypothetical protein ACYS47_09870 [Planctomycetota bacterium]|jgi:hypothetical protein
MKKKRTMPRIFALALSLSLGATLVLVFRATRTPLREDPHPYAEAIRDLSLRFHTRPVLRGPAGTRNAATLYRRASGNLMKGPGEDLHRVLEEGQRPTTEDHDLWIEVNRYTVDTLRKGTAQFGSTLLLDPVRGYEAEAQEVALGPTLAALMIEIGLREWDEGKPLEGARILLDAARFGQDLARGGGVYHRLFSSRVEVMGLRWYLHGLRNGLDSGEALRLLLGELDRLEAGVHPPAETLDMECALFLADLGRAGNEAAGGNPAPLDPEAAEAAAQDWFRRGRDLVSGEDWLDRDRCSAFMETVRGKAPAPLRSAFPDLVLLAFVEKRVETLRRAARIGTALRIFRKAVGSFPERLEALVPDVLASLPTDPLGRGLFRYTRNDDGSASLISAGADGDDDGGRPGPIDLREPSDGDWVFRFHGAP